MFRSSLRDFLNKEVKPHFFADTVICALRCVVTDSSQNRIDRKNAANQKCDQKQTKKCDGQRKDNAQDAACLAGKKTSASAPVSMFACNSGHYDRCLLSA